MKSYTLGFIFNPTYSKVLLMHKNRPDWQKGRLNGVGGKIEEGEESIACIVREIREETGLVTQRHDWILVGTMKGSDWFCDVYGLVYTSTMGVVSAITDEQVEWFDVHALPRNIISNLAWLVPLTVDMLKGVSIGNFSMEYADRGQR